MTLPPSRPVAPPEAESPFRTVLRLRCACGAMRWRLLRTLPPDDDGRRRAYGCAACGRRIDTREVDAYPVMQAEPLYCRPIVTPDAPCPECDNPRVNRCVYLAYDALLATVYTCRECGHTWRTAEILTGGPRQPMPRNARRYARRNALGSAQ